MRELLRKSNKKRLSIENDQSAFIDRQFQMRYTFLTVAACLVGVVLIIGPVFYHVNQNYSIFYELAYLQAPELLKHLEREHTMMNILMAVTAIGTSLFFASVGFQMSKRIVGPLKVLRNHLAALTRGEWAHPPLRVRHNDEFQDVVDTYNYFYRAFTTQALNEYRLLLQISEKLSDPKAKAEIEKLIEVKRNQLQVTDSAQFVATSSNDGAVAESPSLPSAS